MDSEQSQPEEPDFRFKIEGDLRVRVADNMVLIDLDFGRGTEPYAPAASFGVSIPTFESEEQANAWTERVRILYSDDVRQDVIDAMRLRLYDASKLALLETKLIPFDKNGILRDHLALEEKILRERLKIGAGRPAQWNTFELSQAIAEAMRALPSGLRTYTKIAEKLRESHAARAPKTGESLRKTVHLLGINWKQLKGL